LNPISESIIDGLDFPEPDLPMSERRVI